MEPSDHRCFKEGQSIAVKKFVVNKTDVKLTFLYPLAPSCQILGPVDRKAYIADSIQEITDKGVVIMTISDKKKSNGLRGRRSSVGTHCIASDKVSID